MRLTSSILAVLVLLPVFISILLKLLLDFVLSETVQAAVMAMSPL